jgi:hypothetical protein
LQAYRSKTTFSLALKQYQRLLVTRCFSFAASQLHAEAAAAAVVVVVSINAHRAVATTAVPQLLLLLLLLPALSTMCLAKSWAQLTCC